jgi:hypothetical protein
LGSSLNPARRKENAERDDKPGHQPADQREAVSTRATAK